MQGTRNVYDLLIPKPELRPRKVTVAVHALWRARQIGIPKEVSEQEDTRFIGRGLPNTRVIDPETLANGSLRFLDCAVNPIKWKVYEASGQLRQESFELKQLMQIHRQFDRRVLCHFSHLGPGTTDSIRLFFHIFEFEKARACRNLAVLHNSTLCNGLGGGEMVRKDLKPGRPVA